MNSSHNIVWNEHDMKNTPFQNTDAILEEKKKTFYFCFSSQYRQYVIPHTRVLVRTLVLPEARENIQIPQRWTASYFYTRSLRVCKE